MHTSRLSSHTFQLCWNWHSFTVILPHTGSYEFVILLPSVLMSIRCYSFSGWRTPVNFVIIRSSSLCLMDCNQSELDAFLRRAKESAKWAWICLVPMLALLTFDGSRGTRVMGKFQRRKGTGKDPT